MSKYLELFKGSFNDSINEKTKPENKPYIGYSLTDGKIAYTVVPEPASEENFVTFTSEEAGSTIGLARCGNSQKLEYSVDKNIWSQMNTDNSITLTNIGDKVYVRGIYDPMVSGDNMMQNYTQFKMTGKIAASGNCSALWNYQKLNSLSYSYWGYKIFEDCTSLTVAPEIPDVNMHESCYFMMFSGCTSLKEIKCYSPNISDIHTTFWVQNVSPTGTFYKHPNATLETGVSGIPEGWTVVDVEV